MVSSKLISGFTLLNAFTAVSAFWRMQCKGRTGVGLVDPIVAPGIPAAHAHSLHGSSGLSIGATNDDLKDGNCTSCAVEQDKSGYWFPALYFQDDSTGQFEMVEQVGGLLAYYLQRNPANNQKVHAFPDGFRMIAGSADRRNYTLGDPTKPDPPTSFWAQMGQDSQDDLKQRALGFNCLDYSKSAEGSLYRHYLPDKEFTDAKCPDGLRLELMFPSCWNGKDVDSDDHQSHMAYPDIVGDGQCPEGFEVRLVTLFFETIWATGAENFQGRPGRWVLSNGDPTGFGYHGDFMTGWDRDYLQNALDKCTNPSGELTDCSAFMETGPLQTEQEQCSCGLEKSIADIAADTEITVEVLNLPGNVLVQDGPQEADGKATVGGSYPTPSLPSLPSFPDIDSLTAPFGKLTSFFTTSTPTPTPTPYNTPSTPSTPSTPAYPAQTSDSASVADLPGGGFLEESDSGSSTTSSYSTPPPSMTTPPPFTPQPGVSYEVLSTTTATAGNVVQEIVVEQAVVYVTDDAADAAATNKARRGHLRRHAHGHGHH